MHQHRLRSLLGVKDSILIGAASTASVASASVVRVIYSRSAKLKVDFSFFFSFFPFHCILGILRNIPEAFSVHWSHASANFPPLTPSMWCPSWTSLLESSAAHLWSTPAPRFQLPLWLMSAPSAPIRLSASRLQSATLTDLQPVTRWRLHRLQPCQQTHPVSAPHLKLMRS